MNWASDGGVFAKKFNQASDADDVCWAAKETFECFQAWNRPEWQLKGIRATAAYVPNTIVYHYPGFWLSPSLSKFLKHERALSGLNAFVITDDLHRVMDPESECYSHFRSPRQVNLPTGESILTWIDIRLSEDTESFRNAASRRDEESPSSLRTRLLEAIDLFRADLKREEGYGDL